MRTPEQVWWALFQIPAPAANDDTLASRPTPIAQAVRTRRTVAGADGFPINAREAIFTGLGEPIQHRDPPGNQWVVALMDGQGCWWDDAQAMRKLRGVAINEPWDEFTPFRLQRETERLYPERKAHETVEWPWPPAA